MLGAFVLAGYLGAWGAETPVREGSPLPNCYTLETLRHFACNSICIEIGDDVGWFSPKDKACICGRRRAATQITAPVQAELSSGTSQEPPAPPVKLRHWDD